MLSFFKEKLSLKNNGDGISVGNIEPAVEVCIHSIIDKITND